MIQYNIYYIFNLNLIFAKKIQYNRYSTLNFIVKLENIIL